MNEKDVSDYIKKTINKKWPSVEEKKIKYYIDCIRDIVYIHEKDKDTILEHLIFNYDLTNHGGKMKSLDAAIFSTILEHKRNIYPKILN
jgi:hypothetical protein